MIWVVQDDKGRQALIRSDEVQEILHVLGSGATMVTYRNGVTTSFQDKSKIMYDVLEGAWLKQAEEATRCVPCIRG